jgi:hypothetical protein
MKKIGYIIAVIALTISGYFLIKTQSQNTEENKFISNIKAGRKSFDEANWMSPLSVRENDRARLIKDTVIEVMSGKEIALAELLDTSNVFLHYGNIKNSTEMPDIQQFYQKYKGNIRFLLLSNDSLATARNFIQKNAISMPFYVFKNGHFPADIEVFPASHLITNRKTAFYYGGVGYFDNHEFYQYVDKVLTN